MLIIGNGLDDVIDDGSGAYVAMRQPAANIVVDDIIQTIADDSTANVSFTVEHGDLVDIKPVVEKLVKELGAVFPPSSLTGLSATG